LPTRGRVLKGIAFALSFVLLSIAGAYYAMWSSGAGLSSLKILGDMGAGQLALLTILCLGIYAADVLRYRALGLAVRVRVDNRAALDASVANFFFSWITPGSTFGAPASIYMLGRRGVPWDAAVVIAFGKAFTGVALICFASLILVALGLGPEFDARLLGFVFLGGGIFLIIVTLIVVAAFRPAGAKRVVSGVFSRIRGGQGQWVSAMNRVTVRSIDRLASLHGGMALVLLLASHVLYFAVFVGVALVLIDGFGGDVTVAAAATTLVYIAFTYIAPTPGGAGFAEAFALPFFAHILPAEQAVLMVLTFRALTLAMQLVLGMPYLMIVGGLREALGPGEGAAP
jgi:uncharacterized protein (TIRG00374 family)